MGFAPVLRGSAILDLRFANGRALNMFVQPRLVMEMSSGMPPSERHLPREKHPCLRASLDITQ